ncbi:MAG: hypothetical protein KDA35_02945 [Hyphomonadaceae bacterium]|nr:hypothetical protein [Hyphomonadaceae bacterium]
MLSEITLHLARNPDAGVAEGDTTHGYVLVAPLTRDGVLDDQAWHDYKDDCTVRAFSAGVVRHGKLTRRGHNWFFDYERGETNDDEPVFKLERHVFAIGEYVTVTDQSDRPLVYRVSSVRALA